MFRVCALNYHSYTHLIPALGIVREPTIWVCMTSKYSCTHDISLGGYYLGAARGHGGGTAPLRSDADGERGAGRRVGGRAVPA